MKYLRIACSKCKGPMWEEAEPGTNRFIALSCLYCGRRVNVSKPNFEKLKKRLHDPHQAGANKRRAFSAQLRDLSSTISQQG